MDDQVTVERAEPPRKRRRPALSCFECRRRKIKCDRNHPCSQCLQSRIPNCTFAPGSNFPGITNDRANGAPENVVSTAINVTPAQPVTSPKGRTPYSLLVRQFPTPDLSPQTATLVEEPRFSHQTVQDHANFVAPRDPQTIQREPQPETISTKATSQQVALESDYLPIQGTNPELQGILCKNRLHGPSHFVSNFQTS